MTRHVLGTNEMKSNLAGHIRQVFADPHERIYVGAHRQPEAVLMSAAAEFPERELQAMVDLVGRALGYELATGPETPANRDRYCAILTALAERDRAADIRRLLRAATQVCCTSAEQLQGVLDSFEALFGDCLRPHVRLFSIVSDADESWIVGGQGVAAD